MMIKLDKTYWLVQTMADVPATDAWLTESERAFVATLRFPKRRNDWRLGRWTAKHAVCTLLSNGSDSCALSALEIRAAPDGAPEAFSNGKPQLLALSISHSAGAAFCVVAPYGFAVGCDLELVETRPENFVSDFFAEEESELLAQAPHEKRPLYSTLIWSGKESGLKAIRQGLRRDTRSIVVAFDSDKEENGWYPLDLRCLDSSRRLRGWWRNDAAFVQTVVAHPPAAPPTALK